MVYVELPEPGAALIAGEPYGEIESAKTVAELFAPVSGELIEANAELEERPELVNESPYGEGWIARVRLSDVVAAGQSDRCGGVHLTATGGGCMNESDFDRNAVSTRRLAELIDSCSEDDLSADLGGGWTVSHALWHMAFWDVRQIAALGRVALGGQFPLEDLTTNTTLDTLSAAIDPQAAAAAAVAAAANLDSVLQEMAVSEIEALREKGFGYVISRWQHREEHTAQIERALQR